MTFSPRLLGLLLFASSASASVPISSAPGDASAVRSVLAHYNAAVERLDLIGTEALFAKDSRILESGSDEGNYAYYKAHHLVPELAEFKSLRFSDYKINVHFEGVTALVIETYKYRIETKKGEVAERFGVSTSVLRKAQGRWQVIMLHSSARRPSN